MKVKVENTANIECLDDNRRLSEVEYENFEWYDEMNQIVQVLRCFTVMNDALGEWENSNLRRLNFVNCHVSFTFTFC